MWTVKIANADDDVAVLTADDLHVGEWALIFGMVVSNIPHRELDVSPLHCPVCRSSIASVALTRTGMAVEDAVEHVAQMTLVELINCVDVTVE